MQAALHQWLGDLIAVEQVAVKADDAVLEVTVRYTIRASAQSRVEQFRSAL